MSSIYMPKPSWKTFPKSFDISKNLRWVSKDKKLSKDYEISCTIDESLLTHKSVFLNPESELIGTEQTVFSDKFVE